MVDPAILSSISLTGPEPVGMSTTVMDWRPVICSEPDERMATRPVGAGSAERIGTALAVGVGVGAGEMLGEGLGAGEAAGVGDGLGSVEGCTDGVGDALGSGEGDGAAAAIADHAVTATSATAQATASAARRPPAWGALPLKRSPFCPRSCRGSSVLKRTDAGILQRGHRCCHVAAPPAFRLGRSLCAGGPGPP